LSDESGYSRYHSLGDTGATILQGTCDMSPYWQGEFRPVCRQVYGFSRNQNLHKQAEIL